MRYYDVSFGDCSCDTGIRRDIRETCLQRSVSARIMGDNCGVLRFWVSIVHGIARGFIEIAYQRELANE